MAERFSVWNKEKLVAAIRERDARGLSLRPCAVRNSGRKGRAFYSACRNHFGSWRKAVGAAGFDYDALLVRTCPWTQEQFVERIRELSRTGGPLTPHALERLDPTLFRAGHRYFGTWRKAVEAAGVVYPVPLRPHVNWTRAEVIRRIRARRRAGEPLNALAVDSGSPALLRQARDLYGTWEAAITAAGLDYSLIRRTRPWTRVLILQTIRARRAAGKPLNHKAVQTEDGGFVASCYRYFGSFRKAVAAAGIDYSTVLLPRSRWTRELVIAELRRLANDIRAGGDPTETCRRREALRNGAKLFKGGWPETVKAAGLLPHDLHPSHADRMAGLFAREREPWSEAETARFKLLVRNRTPALAIAIHLARSGTAIVAKARELRLRLVLRNA